MAFRSSLRMTANPADEPPEGPIDHSSPPLPPEKQPRKARRWRKTLLRWGGLGLVLLLVAGISAWFVFRKVEPHVRPPAVAAWALDRFVPGLKLEVEDFAWEGAGGLRLDGVRITETRGGEILAEIRRVTLRWTAAGLWSGRLESLELTEPVFRLTPATLAPLQKISAASSGKAAAPALWEVGLLRCDYGTFLVEEMGGEKWTASGHFSADWRELGTRPASAAKAQSLLLWGLSAGLPGQPALVALDWVKVDFILGEVLHKGWIEEVAIKGGNLDLTEEMQAVLRGSADGEPKATGQQAMEMWLGKVGLQDLRIRVEGAAPLGAEIVFDLNTTLQAVPLGRLPETLGEETQLIELAWIELRSPLDPLVRIITIHSVFVYFTLDGLLNHRLQRVVLLNPVLYLSQDLFVYMQEMSEAQAETETETQGQPSALDWRIEELRIEYGSLILGGERLGQVGLPLSFSTTATNVSLDNLASLRLQADLEIRTQDFSFPPLQLTLEQLGGDLKFSYPPEDDLNNLVNVLRLQNLKWRQFSAKDLWLAATFDARGIFALAGGEAYGGYVNAGVSFFFEPEGRWLGWVTGQALDMTRLTSVLAPQNFRMTGPADFKVEVDGRKKLIQRLRGSLEVKQSGEMRISKLDDILADLPQEWSQLKRSMTTLAMESLRDFSYTSARAEFWYVEEQGKLTLRLPGPSGSRNLTLRLHADDTSDGLWKLDQN